MSDIMLLGVLRMPLPDDPAEVDSWMWVQLKDRIQEAATRIERDADRITGLEADLREEQDRRQAMRNEWAAEVAALTAQARHAEDCLDAAKARITDLEKPIDMVLHCPACLEQHIDEPERSLGPDNTETLDWDNPPHRSHLCKHCGFVWRPADVATNGVFRTKTHGKNDMVLIDGPAHELRMARLAQDMLNPVPLNWDGDRP